MYTIEQLLDDPKDIRMQHLRCFIDDWDKVLDFVNTASTVEEAKHNLYLSAYYNGGEYAIVSSLDDF